MKILKLIIFYILSILLFISCGDKNIKSIYSIYETSIEIKYEDNSKDTIINIQEVYYRSRLNYEIETEIIGLFSITTTTPCLIVKNGNKKEKIACYVKTYRILEQTNRNKTDKK